MCANESSKGCKYLFYVLRWGGWVLVKYLSTNEDEEEAEPEPQTCSRLLRPFYRRTKAQVMNQRKLASPSPEPGLQGGITISEEVLTTVAGPDLARPIRTLSLKMACML